MNLPVTPEQIVELTKGSTISSAIIEKAGLYSIDDAKAAAKMFGVPWRAFNGHLPVLVFPYRLPGQRDPVLFRGKPAKAFEEKKRDGSVKAKKYIQATKTGTHLYFGPSLLSGEALRDTSRPLIVTEGEKKCLAAESAGFSCIAVPGTSQWCRTGEKTLHPYFAHVELKDRVVYVAFDEDSMRNQQVRKDELAVGRALEAVGAHVFIVRFTVEAPKLDDFLAAHELTEFHALLADARKNGKLPEDTRGPSDEDWLPLWPMLRIDRESERPVKDVDTMVRVLEHHPSWRGVFAFDSRSERQLLLKEPPFAADVKQQNVTVPRAVSDSDAVRVADWFVGQRVLGWQLAPKTAQVEQAITLVCERHRYDPVQEYLKALKWDGVGRLDAAAARYLGAEDTAYNGAVFAKWLLSAVARARTPGCKADHVIVLEGGQGTGKSTALQILAGDPYFSDGLPDIGSKDAYEHCLSKWIIELAELDHVRKSEVTALKAFLTARSPSFRHAYAKRTTEHPRRCVFAGSTNESTYLTDSTGNRRFWPLKCGAIDLEALSADRDQLWAEALVRVRAGESWHLTDEVVKAEAEAQQRNRRTVDPWAEIIARYVHGRDQVTLHDVSTHLGMPTERFGQREANRIVAVLREMGWVRRRVTIAKGLRAWIYEPGPLVPDSIDGADVPGQAQVVDIFTKIPLVPLVPVYSLEGYSEDGAVAVAGGTHAHDTHGKGLKGNEWGNPDTGTRPSETDAQQELGESDDGWES